MDENAQVIYEAKVEIYSIYRLVLRHWIDMCDDNPTGWSKERALASIAGSAISDDPPDGWGESRIAQFARGWAYGESNLADNLRFRCEAWMLRNGMDQDVAPAPWDVPKGEAVKAVRHFLVTHKCVSLAPLPTAPATETKE